MSKKLSGNGMWESSRMMLPEHKEEIIRRNKDIFFEAPHLDDHQIERIHSALNHAITRGSSITVTYHNQHHEFRIQGNISKVNDVSRYFLLQSATDNIRIDYDSIIDVTISDVM